MEIENEIRKIVCSHVDVVLDPDKIQNNGTFDLLGINSINFIRVIIELEEKYSCEFDIDMLSFDAYPNFGEFVKYVKSIVPEN